MSRFRYRAFISYSHSDESWARWLHRSLEWYRVPKHIVGRATPRGPIPKRLAPIFRDREELASASDLGSVLENALASSQALIVICSPAAARSRWVNEEIRFFKNLGRADQVYCLIVDGEPNSGKEAGDGAECFPPALLEAAESEGENAQVEPIAADVRPGGDGKQAAKLKLVAGLLGVGLDEIRQRENQRRQRRLIQIASGAVAGMLVAIALATAALMARAEAERQRVIAEQQAETASQTSEFLVSLFSVVDPGEARGNTITAREILDRGAAKIENELEDQPAVRANLLDSMGRVYKGLGLFADSEELLAKSLAVGKDAGRAGTKGEISSSIVLAEAYFNSGKYKQAIDMASGAVAAARDAEDGATVLSDALIVQADVLDYYFKDHTRAEGLYQEAISVAASLPVGEPDAEILKAKALNGLGYSLFEQDK
ncbi:MAG: toll/interleukin-1 receptor domain-containing protein, partial [Gammaproteobacteria bacterium]|nr:toll/interleukin-1 receptor domain-containing protein [Gammaproteobacteria bacterium]